MNTSLKSERALIVYFSQMFQAVPALAQVYARTGGVFVSSRRSTLSAVRTLYPDISRARFSKRVSWLRRGNKLMEHADVIVTGSPYKKLLAPYRAKKCMVFHGTYMFFTREAIESNAHFDLLCVTGPRMQSMIDRHPDIGLNCVTTGFLPFAEFPERNVEFREKKLINLGLDPNRQTILYTPSRKSVGSWGMLAERLVQETPREFNLILRPHPSQSITARLGDRVQFLKINKLCRARGNALLERIENPLPHLLAVTDLVVSDANSPAEESLFYDLPQLFIRTELHSLDKLAGSGSYHGLHPDDLENLMSLYECGENFWLTHGNLSKAIEKCFVNSEDYAVARQRYFEWVFGERDRMAAERVTTAIKTLY